MSQAREIVREDTTLREVFSAWLQCLLSFSAIFSSLHALWRVLHADGRGAACQMVDAVLHRKGVPGVQGEKFNVGFALSAAKPNGSLCCPVDGAARWLNICL